MIDRRKFLRLGGGALIASATMAEAGVVAEMLDWLKRKPAFSFPERWSASLSWYEPATLSFPSEWMLDIFSAGNELKPMRYHIITGGLRYVPEPPGSRPFFFGRTSSRGVEGSVTEH